MARKIVGPRKQRTRGHVIADLSVHHVEGFILDEGHTAQRLDSDYGYDLVLFTYDERGYIEPDSVYFQLKAAESLAAVGSAYVFDLDIFPGPSLPAPRFCWQPRQPSPGPARGVGVA
jgi:hypothetical protein